MKKIIALLTVLVMLVSSFSVAYADNNDGTAATDIVVNGVFQAGKEAGIKVSVDITWDEMSFTYVDGDKGEWQPDKHSYADDAIGAWNSETKTVTVTNHSNTAVAATLSFTPSVNGLIGSFTENSGSANDGILLLPSAAEGSSLGNVNAAPSVSAEFGISGSKISANASLGIITVSISADGEYEPEQGGGGNNPAQSTVEDQASLAAAVAAGGEIVLGSDISGTEMSISNDVSVDLAGNNWMAYTAGINLSGGTLTLKDSVGGGAVSSLTYTLTVSEGAKLVVIGSVAFNHSANLTAIEWKGGIIDLSAATGESYTITVREEGSASAQNLIMPSGYAMYDSAGNMLGALPQTTSKITIKPIV